MAHRLSPKLFKLNLEIINLSKAKVPFLYPLKISENLWFSDVCRGDTGGTLAWDGLMENFNFFVQMEMYGIVEKAGSLPSAVLGA